MLMMKTLYRLLKAVFIECGDTELNLNEEYLEVHERLDFLLAYNSSCIV